MQQESENTRRAVSKRGRDLSKEVSPRCRRSFLKTSAALVSATLADNLALDQSAYAAGSDILKIGLIGCGPRGSGAAVKALNADKNTVTRYLKRAGAQSQALHDEWVAFSPADERDPTGAYDRLRHSDTVESVFGTFVG